eukprot:PhM_4_TR18067/c0_g1_i2/m.78339/K09668/LARGE; glycosyltransferase-like protein LARGE
MSHIITLTTHLSLDRIDRLRQQARAWAPWPVVAAVWNPSADAHDVERLVDLGDNVTMVQLTRADVSKGSVVLNQDNNNDSDDAVPYPINALRNLAMRSAKTSLVYVLDVDQIPCGGAVETLSLQLPLLHFMCEDRKHVCVVPCFERSKNTVNNSLVPFYSDSFPPCQGPTDYKRWSELNEKLDEVIKKDTTGGVCGGTTGY